MSVESQKKRMGVEILKTTTTERIAKIMTERIAKIMTENSPNMVKDINLKTQEAQWKKKRKRSSVNAQKDKFKEIPSQDI